MISRLEETVRAQAQQRPGATALRFRDRTLTYGELDAQTNRLARLLIGADCRPGDRVALMVPKSIEAIVGMIGALKAGAIYVPIDTTSPPPRARAMMEACESRCALVAGRGVELLDAVIENGASAGSLRVGWLEDDAAARPPGIAPAFTLADLDAVPGSEPPLQEAPSPLAHILFTSGSTGVPKGVPIQHSNVAAFLEWALPYFGTAPGDRVSGHPPLHFDLSTFDIYGTLAAGAELHLVPPEMSLLPHKLAEFIRSRELTQWFSVPSLLNYMTKFDVVRTNDFPALRRLLWCGEKFPTPSLIYWMSRLPHVEFTNLYGPTEATIASSYYRVPECPRDEQAEIPIGAACGGEELLVLDGQMRPAAPGEVGDLYIRGVGLSPGYWRDPAKTSQAFVANPLSGDPADRIYRTGDLASVGAGGLFYLHGRADAQIKSRGYRIELGEIETALQTIPELETSACVAVEGGFEGVVICCAYTSGSAPLEPAGIRERLEKTLPHYMIPSRWMELETMPLNANGKIDRPRLRELFRATVKTAGQG